jgi:Tol biopolymer transport system component
MITAGQQILHYRLTEKLGEGGMGVVWKATDTSLDRQVAIKVLPPHFASDPERLARFEREARLLASLNHANIATVHSVHLLDGVRYLTMELVPGEDLAQRIVRGPVPVPEAIEIARQITLALEAAHESGVVHRDLKPANVRITPDGRVKVLDFGLAKAMETSGAAPVLSQSPTFVGTVMASGMIIGTAAYMSPEQARGQTVDRRADIWAFGVVLYEMLTGRRAFEGETVSDTLAAVLRAEPDRALLPKDLPRRVRSLLERCLQKDARRRLRDIGEAVLVLEDVQTGRPEAADAAPATAPRVAGRERLLWSAGLIVVVVLVALGVAALRPTIPGKPLRKFTLALEHQGGEISSPTISPDGRQVAYVVARRLWVRDFTQLTSRMLAEGLDEDFRPAWSPDGASLAFGTGSGLSRVAVASGAIAPVCAVSEFSGGSGGSWTSDGRIVFAKGQDHLYVVAAGGGTPSVYLQKDSLDADLHHPHVLPGGQAVLYVRHLVQGGPITLAVARDGKPRDLLKLPSGFTWEPVYDPRGFILYSRLGEGAGLWALPFSPDRLEATGEAFLVAPEGASASIGSDGSLVYRLGTMSVESQAVLVDGSGAIVDTLTQPRAGNVSLALAPDDNSLVVETRETAEGDLWLHDLVRHAQTRFAFGPGRQMEATWSPDGRQVAYRDLPQDAIFLKPADGSKAPLLVARGWLAQFTPDGLHLVYGKPGINGSSDIWYTTLGATRDTVAWLATAAIEDYPMPAPQGGHLLFVSDESGRQEVFLRQFPSGEGRWQVSTNGGGRPLWSRQGDRIYYSVGEDIYEVEVSLQPSVRLGTPVRRFDLGDLKMQYWGRHNFLPTSRPDRFVMLKPTERVAISLADVVVVDNWPAEFGKK